MTARPVSRETTYGGYLTSEAAAMVAGVSEATIRKWVERGYLVPVNPGKKPSRFRELDVWRCARDRLSVAQRRQLYGMWDTLLSDES